MFTNTLVYLPIFSSYSPSHIAQIMDFGDFLHEYSEEKSETYTEF